MPDDSKKDPREASESLDALLEENRRFEPSDEFRANAVVRDPKIYEKAGADPEGFWSGFASELQWRRPWNTVLQGEGPEARWFVGGETNASVNCLDRHVEGGLRNKAALIWEGEPGDRRTMTYFDLYRDVNMFANALRKLGIGAGDRVAIYLPMIPEAVVAMLACARIGAIHSVVFGGFSAESLRDRIIDAEAKLLITADGCYRRGNLLPLKHDADYALRETPTIENVIVIKRGDFPLRIKEGRDHWYHRLMQDAEAHCEPEWVDSNHPLFILYTSGTTGQPKGIMHSTGGYLTGTYATTKWVFDLKDDDVFWCTADIGWITGHSYIVYGPLAAGATVVLYGDPGVHEMGRQVAGRPRSLTVAAAGDGRRADQSRGLDVVPRARGRGPLPDRRYVVADRDRSDPDNAAAGNRFDQARFCHPPVPRCLGGDSGRGWRRDLRGRRFVGDHRSMARTDPGDLGRRAALPRNLLEQVGPQHIFPGRRSQAGR
jgi:hypothetical protein